MKIQKKTVFRSRFSRSKVRLSLNVLAGLMVLSAMVVFSVKLLQNGGNVVEAQTPGVNPTPITAACPATLTVSAPSGATDISSRNFAVAQTLAPGSYVSSTPITISNTLTISGVVSIYAPSVTVTGLISGIGGGHEGGARAAILQPTNDGVGPGAGHGGNPANPDPASGAGYGGVGGASNANNGGKPGGVAYGYSTDYDVDQGSGGGGGNCGAAAALDCSGGSGGAAIRIYSQDIAVSGAIRVRGNSGGSVDQADPANAATTGGAEAGGGGSGGGILLSGWSVNITGVLSAFGGDGGDALNGGPSTDDGAGGGAGGRIKIFRYSGFPSTVTPSTVNVSGGVAGTQPATNVSLPGEPGTYSIGVCTSPQLTVTKTASANPVAPGQSFDYTVTVVNQTGGSISGIVASDNYDSKKLTVKSIGDFSTNVSGTLASAPFALAPNATKTLKYTVTVVNPYPAYSTAQDKVITNNVTVTASNFAPQHASTTVNVLLLKIAKSLNPDTIVTEGSLAPGSTFPVYLAIQNDSQVDMTGLLIDDDLSAGFKSGLIKSVSNISDNGVFDSNTKHILWANVSAPKGIQKQLAFAIVLNSTAPSNATTLTNTFTVSQSQLGKLTSNQVKVTVSPSAPVVITPPVQTVPRKVPTTGAGEVVGIIVAVLVGIVGVVVYLGYKEGWFKKFSKPESK